MLDKIISALKARKDLAGWSVRHVASRGAQVYAVGKQVEARRDVDEEKYTIEVLRHTKTADGKPAAGNGDSTVLPGGDIDAAIEQAALMAGLVANPPYEMPAESALPDTLLVDTEVEVDSLSALNTLMDRMRDSAAKHSDVELTSAEGFASEERTHLVNSRGIDAEQKATEVEVEFVLQSRKGDRNSETQREMTRRRVVDLNLENEVELRAQYTRDLLEASAPPAWQGPVVIRRDALGVFMAGDGLTATVARTLGSAASKYSKVSPWELGKSVFRGEVKGDPLHLWGNRRVPYGSRSNRFDAEGLPAQRVPIIVDNKLFRFSAAKRYADYLAVPATGDFGVAEVAPGTLPAASLLDEPYVEVNMFSWFNPEPISGNFSSEIRLGYLVRDGKATPFKGGQLIGNWLDALADVYWSEEVGFYGNYLGPNTARFNNLKVAAT